MTKEDIINGSKLIAEFLGWKYIPSNNLQVHSRAGWYETIDAKPNLKEVTQTSYKHGEEDKAIVKTITMDVNRFKYNQKSGWSLVGGRYYKYVCRKHSELRFWNSLDALVPVIQKIEKEKVNIRLNNNGCHFYCRESENSFESYDENLSWSNNVFIVVVKYLENERLSN